MNSMKLLALTLVISMIFVGTLLAEDQSTPNADVGKIVRQQAMLDQDIALELAPIKSSAELQQHMMSAGMNSPLSWLSTPARKRFIASLRFNEKGITSFKYEDLQAELTASQIYQVLSLFGAQHTVAMMRNARVESPIDEQIMKPLTDPSDVLCPSQPCDYEGYECAKKATCATNINTICMRNC